jgi:hypothetical protein
MYEQVRDGLEQKMYDQERDRLAREETPGIDLRSNDPRFLNDAEPSDVWERLVANAENERENARQAPRESKERKQSSEPREQAPRVPQRAAPRRRIVRGKIDDPHVSQNDPTIRNREAHVDQLLSIYGLRNDRKMANGHEKKLDPDLPISRLANPHRLRLNEHERTFSVKNYLNRHVVLPNEASNDYYYRVDDSAKNEEYQGLLVEVIGAKWIGSSKKIAWKCKTVGSGQEFYTLFLDATSRIQKSNQDVQRALRAKKKTAQRCFREDTVSTMIEQLESAAREMRNSRAEPNIDE